MENLSPAVQHHKTALNIYHKGVPVLPGNRCKKCRGRDVECIKIKFPAGKESRKCALCAVSGGNCAYEAPDLAPAESVSSSTSSMLPRTSPSPPEPGVTSGPEPEVERMMTAPRGPPPDPAQGQMLLQYGGYVEQQLHPLRLDIQINRDDIIKFGSVDFSLTNLSSIKPDCTDLIDSDSINIDFTIY